MMRLKHLLLVVFFFVLISHATDAQKGQATIHVKAGFSFSGMIGKILKLPITIMKTVLQLPLTIIQKIVQIMLEVVGQLNTAGSAVATQVVKVIKQVASQIVDVLVSVGVLQGKTTEDVVNGVFGIIQKLITFFKNFEMKISSTIVNTFNGIISKLDIKMIISKIMNLPLVKNIVQLIKDIRTFITTNFQNQIDDVKGLIKKEYIEHEDFFKPIFDGISSRILIITNALQALMHGKLSDCPGRIWLNKSPSSGLHWQIQVWIYQGKVNILKVLGLTDLADKAGAKLDELKDDNPNPTTTSDMGTSPGMSTMPAGMSTLSPAVSTMPEALSALPPAMSTTPEGMSSMSTLSPAMSTMPAGVNTLPPAMSTLVSAATTSGPFGSITFSVSGNVTSAEGTTTPSPPTT